MNATHTSRCVLDSGPAVQVGRATCESPVAGRRRPVRQARGVVAVIALVLLVVILTLSVAYAATTDMSLMQADNGRASLQARLAAEGGLDFTLNQLWRVRLPAGSDPNALALALSKALGDRLNGTANLQGATVACEGTVVTVPTINLDGKNFTATFTWMSPTTCQLKVKGTCGNLSRTLTLMLGMTVRRSGAFDYGLASKGPVTLSGNAKIIGVNRPLEASVLSATTSSINAITVDGSVFCSGDLSVTGSSILIKGNPIIGNTGDPNQWAQHCHFGVEPPDFPMYDTAPMAPLATNLLDSSTPLGSKTTLTNIRIKAGTNPTFNNHMTINGIVYVESPNIVRFEGQATVNGMIITEEGTGGSNCQIHFAGGVDAYGVEVLPNTAEFTAVKGKKGTFLLAPGFGLTFAGNVNAVNGNIAADQLTFTGTATGLVKGSIIGLKDKITTLNGTVDIYVDRDNAVEDPAGFVKVYALVVDPDTYSEVIDR